ncbi:CopG family transcriptional regulator [Novosphingobium profundi]|uniref:CopG family transcriptional regulator n=1 Tax=Novosphingobium profundi TaxID=1774954 RepID=UPI001CFCDA5A|nr:CopG family transcriptional regulator [Novosphingobium profundi]
MAAKVRHQLFLPRSTSERLVELARQPGASKSDILAQALTAWLDRQARSELDERFGRRLDRIATLLERLQRDSQIELETLALFIRYELAIHPPLAEDDKAGRAAAARRFEAFLAQVARQVGQGRRTLDPGAGQ